jgi:hypothetical protein
MALKYYAQTITTDRNGEIRRGRPRELPTPEEAIEEAGRMTDATTGAIAFEADDAFPIEAAEVVELARFAPSGENA